MISKSKDGLIIANRIGVEPGHVSGLSPSKLRHLVDLNVRHLTYLSSIVVLSDPRRHLFRRTQLMEISITSPTDACVVCHKHRPSNVVGNGSESLRADGRYMMP